MVVQRMSRYFGEGFPSDEMPNANKPLFCSCFFDFPALGIDGVLGFKLCLTNVNLQIAYKLSGNDLSTR